jgi:hypothetical protein
MDLFKKPRDLFLAIYIFTVIAEIYTYSKSDGIDYVFTLPGIIDCFIYPLLPCGFIFLVIRFFFKIANKKNNL